MKRAAFLQFHDRHPETVSASLFGCLTKETAIPTRDVNLCLSDKGEANPRLDGLNDRVLLELLHQPIRDFDPFCRVILRHAKI
jgi:hypothetical protein